MVLFDTKALVYQIRITLAKNFSKYFFKKYVAGTSILFKALQFRSAANMSHGMHFLNELNKYKDFKTDFSCSTLFGF